MTDTHTISLAFFGQYRPAHWTAATIQLAIEAAEVAMTDCDAETRRTASAWMRDAKGAQRRGYSSFSAEYGALAVSWRPRAHDSFLDRVTADFAPFPGLTY